MTETLRPVGPSTIPQLSARFEPVSGEIDTDALRVEGRLPSDLTGFTSATDQIPSSPPSVATRIRWKATVWSTDCGSKKVVPAMPIAECGPKEWAQRNRRAIPSMAVS